MPCLASRVTFTIDACTHRLSLTLVFGFEQDPDAEEEEEGSEVEVMD